MPTKSARKCAKAGCNVMTTSGYCKACAAKRNEERSEWRKQNGKTRWDDKNRPTASQRGYNADWHRIRQRVLKRDKNLCQLCLRSGKLTPATVVDHIKPKFKGGTNEMHNLRALCSPCHHIKTQQEAREGKRLKGGRTGGSGRAGGEPTVFC